MTTRKQPPAGTIRIRSNAAEEYQRWQSSAERAWEASFPSYADASHFVRLAGGRDARRTGAAWTWTMPDGWTATLSDDRDDRSIVFAPPSAGDERAKLQHAADVAYDAMRMAETEHDDEPTAGTAWKLANAILDHDRAMLELGKYTTNPHA
jgi:hypothetical protein